MPRLGAETNAASAYPNGHPNLRGSWLRQFITTAAGTVLLMLVFKNLVFKDYKTMTVEGMKKRGIKEEAINKIVPKTRKEKEEEELAAKENMNRVTRDVFKQMQYQIGNLTVSVHELQRKIMDMREDVTFDHLVELPQPQDLVHNVEQETGAEDPVENTGTNAAIQDTTAQASLGGRNGGRR